MEFTTRISEQDFLDAYHLKSNFSIQKIARVFLYFLTAICGLLLIIAFINMWQHPEDQYAAQSPFFFLFTILPFEILAFCYVLFLNLFIPYRLHRVYRKDMSQKGEMTVQLSPKGVTEKSSDGANVYFPWTHCDRWRESQRVFVLIVQSGVYFIFPKACLSAAQQDELRGILIAALPKK